MAAFNYTQPPDASVDQISANRKVYSIELYNGSTGSIGVGTGPIPYVTRYSPSGSVAFLYIQTDRILSSTGSMTTAGNYVINGVSAPTVTAVNFTAGKNHIRLTLSGLLPSSNAYTLSIADKTFTDGVDSVYNITGIIPIYVDHVPTQSGIDEIINVGTPIMS